MHKRSNRRGAPRRIAVRLMTSSPVLADDGRLGLTAVLNSGGGQTANRALARCISRELRGQRHSEQLPEVCPLLGAHNSETPRGENRSAAHFRPP